VRGNLAALGSGSMLTAAPASAPHGLAMRLRANL
jgi:hypothetical protein